MPRPGPHEDKQSFISRAIKHFRHKENIPQDEAIGRAFGYWKTYGGKKKKKGKLLNYK